MKHICPKCGGRQFITTAYVAQDWLVDETGDFLSVVEESTNSAIE